MFLTAIRLAVDWTMIQEVGGVAMNLEPNYWIALTVLMIFMVGLLMVVI